eukprot:COSAG01_NODE_2238_length_8089_cov_5.948936_8_plen_120_part_00
MDDAAGAGGCRCRQPQELRAALVRATLSRDEVESAYRQLPTDTFKRALVKQLVRVRLSDSYVLATVDGVEDVDETYSFAGQVGAVPRTVRAWVEVTTGWCTNRHALTGIPLPTVSPILS